MTTSPALIDWQNPRTDHWAWDSMVLGLMAVPGRKGWKTSKWRSLDHRYPGTLTNMDPATDWVIDSPVSGLGSLDFDGVDDYVNLGPGSNFAIGSNDFTISAWVKLTSVSTYQVVIGNDTNASTRDTFIGVGNTPGKIIYFTQRNGSGGATIVQAGSLTAGRWHHIAARRSGTSLRLFQDGVDVGGTTDSQTGVVNGGEWNIGRRAFSGFEQYLGGNVASVQINFAALNVAALYDESRCGYPTMLRRLPTRRYFFLAATGGTGSLAATLGALTSSSAGELAISGLATPTLGSLAALATGELAISATASNTLGSLSLSSAGALAIQATASSTLGSLTLSASGGNTIGGSLNATLGELTTESAAALEIQATSSGTLGALTSSATGELAIAGSTDAALGALTSSASGTSGNTGSGTLTASLGALTSSATGTITLAGAVDAVLGALTSSASGELTISGSATQTLGSLTLSSSGTSAPTIDRIGLSTATLRVGYATGTLRVGYATATLTA